MALSLFVCPYLLSSFQKALDELVAKGFRLAPKEYRKIVELAQQRGGKGGVTPSPPAKTLNFKI